MKNITILILSIILSMSLYNCGGRGKPVSGSAWKFDSTFNEFVGRNLPKAKSLVDSLEKTSQDSVTQYLAKTYRAICFLAEYQLDSVHIICDRAEKFFTSDRHFNKEQYRVAMKNICTSKGIAYSYSRDVDSATKYFEAAIRYEELRNLPQAYLNLADNLNQNGRHVEAAEWYRRTMQINDSVGNVIRDDFIFAGLAMSYMDISAFDEAEKYLNKAKDNLSMMSCYDKYILYNNYGNLYYYQRKYEKARGNFIEAYNNIVKSGSSALERSVPLFNLAEIYILQHKADSAEMCIDTIGDIIAGTEAPVFRQHLKTLKMALATERNNLPLAAQTIESFSENILTPELDRIRNRYLQIYYEKAGLFKEAYVIAKSNYNITDSINRTKDKVKIDDIYIRYKQDTMLINKQNQLVVKDEQLRRSRTFWFSTAIILVLLIVVIFYNSRRQRDKIIARHIQKISKMRVENIRNCLSPHFMFNVINHEIATYEEDDPHRKNLLSLSKILRRCVELSSQMTVTLAEEIDFVDAYIQLECSQWCDDFSYNLKLSEGIDVNSVIIPSMFLQIPVENAIKHGFSGCGMNRRLDIEIIKEVNGIRLVVINNGMAYKPQMITSGTGTGMKVIYQTIAFLNSFNVSKIEVLIRANKSAEGKEEGARLEIFIPSNFNYQTIQTE